MRLHKKINLRDPKIGLVLVILLSSTKTGLIWFRMAKMFLLGKGLMQGAENDDMFDLLCINQ